MPVKLRLKHSATANKEPLPADLLEGELALNINSASPAAYIKDSTGVIRKIAGITVSGTAPAMPTAGMAWLDVTVPTKPVFKVYDGTAWQGAGSGVSTGVTAPTSPAAGDLWVDTTVPTAPVVNIWNGTAFVPVVPAAVVVPDATETVKGIVELATAAETTTGTDATRAVHPAGLKVELDKKATKTVTSDTAPTNPKDGDLWYDSVGGELYVWYDSDDAGAVAGTWVQANPQPTAKQATASVAGVVQLADAAAITAGTAGRVVDAAQMKADRMTAAGPAFSAFQNSQQSLTANTWTLGAFQAEEFDTANCYSTSTYAFTPNVAGYYLVTGGFQIASTGTALLTQFYKNGSAYKTTNWPSSASAAYGSVLVYLNGTTDYVQLYVYSGVTQNTTANAVVTYFQGHFVRPA